MVLVMLPLERWWRVSTSVDSKHGLVAEVDIQRLDFTQEHWSIFFQLQTSTDAAYKH